jgi:hypothetical protein
MSFGEQRKKNLEKNNKQITNEKQTNKSHETTSMETSEIQQTHLTKKGYTYILFGITFMLKWRSVLYLLAFTPEWTTPIQFWTNNFVDDVVWTVKIRQLRELNIFVFDGLPRTSSRASSFILDIYD